MAHQTHETVTCINAATDIARSSAIGAFPNRTAFPPIVRRCARSCTRLKSSGWQARDQESLIHLPGVSPDILQRDPVRIERHAIRRQDDNGLTNRIGDRAKVVLTLLQLLQYLLLLGDIYAGADEASKSAPSPTGNPTQRT